MNELKNHVFRIATSFLYRSDHSHTGVATAAVTSPLSADSFITHDTEPVMRTPKATLACRYRLEDLLVINIHAINVVGFDAFQNQLEKVRRPLMDHAGPVVFGGDFNTNT